jgi:hypothetical protein
MRVVSRQAHQRLDQASVLTGVVEKTEEHRFSHAPHTCDPFLRRRSGSFGMTAMKRADGRSGVQGPFQHLANLDESVVRDSFGHGRAKFPG